MRRIHPRDIDAGDKIVLPKWGDTVYTARYGSIRFGNASWFVTFEESGHWHRNQVMLMADDIVLRQSRGGAR